MKALLQWIIFKKIQETLFYGRIERLEKGSFGSHRGVKEDLAGTLNVPP